MSAQTHTKVQVQQKTLSGSSPKSSLLQRTYACGQHTIAGAQCSACRSEQSTLLRSQRAFEPPSVPGAVPGGSPTQENGSSFSSAFDRASRFGHDFSQIPIHSPAAGVMQTKLAINQPGDHYEQEADRISEQVMRMSEPQPQRGCACGGACPKCQTEQPGWEHERLQTKRVQASDMGQMAVPPIVHEVLRSPGQPLGAEVSAFMEPRFGHDFSQVRVHTGAVAEQSAREVNAYAYTVGHNMVFGTGRFTPGMHGGRRLIAHELTHVVQQLESDGSGFGQSTEEGGLSPNFFTALQMKSTMGTLPSNPGVVAMAGSGGVTANPSISPTVDDLTSAIFNHDIGQVQQLISIGGVDVNALDKNGMTPLTEATKDGDIQIMELLINNSAQVDGKNNDRETPLIVAAKSGNQQAAEFLLKHKAWVNAQDLQHRGPLFLSVQNGDLKMVKFFLQKGADVDLTADGGETSLMEAASKGNQDIMKALIQNGANVNKEDANNRTALMEAASTGDPKSVKLLLDKHADPNKVDKFHQTALMEASRSGNAQATTELLNAKADVNVQDEDDRTALIRAAMKGNHDAVKVLVRDPKTDVNLKDSKGATALIEAAKSGDVDTLMGILQSKHKVDLNVQDNNGKSALMEAASSGKPGMVKALVQTTPKPDLNLQDPDGNTALILAVAREDVAGVKVLVQFGAKLDVTNKFGDTALSTAQGMVRMAMAPDTIKASGEILSFLQKFQPKPKP